MNLSLYKLRKQIKRDKSGQGSLVAIVLAGLVGSILVSSATSWYLSMRNNMGNLEDKLEAQTIAQSEWERLSHMSLDELEAKRGELAEKYSAGSDSQYQISVNLGEKGTFNNSTCGDIGSDGYANCFKDTTITVYRDGNRMFTTRTLPLMAGNYTRKEIDDKFASLKKEVDDKFASLLRLEPIDEEAEIPEGKALYAYLDGQKLPVSQSGSGKLPELDYKNARLGVISSGDFFSKYSWGETVEIPSNPRITFTAPTDGIILLQTNQNQYNDDNSGRQTVYVNGIIVGNYNNIAWNPALYNHFVLFLKKGDVVSCLSDDNWYSFTKYYVFFPVK